MSQPIVEGILCSRGHLNPDWIAYCWRCGTALAPEHARLGSGPPPPVGALVADDGTITPVIGKIELGQAAGARSSSPDEPGLTVRAEGWRVLLANRSGETAAVKRPDGRGWRSLHAGDELELLSGSEIRLGPRSLTFDSHLWRRRESASHG